MSSLPVLTYKHTAWVTRNKALDRQVKKKINKKTTKHPNELAEKKHIFPEISAYAFTFLI